MNETIQKNQEELDNQEVVSELIPNNNNKTIQEPIQEPIHIPIYIPIEETIQETIQEKIQEPVQEIVIDTDIKINDKLIKEFKISKKEFKKLLKENIEIENYLSELNKKNLLISTNNQIEKKTNIITKDNIFI